MEEDMARPDEVRPKRRKSVAVAGKPNIVFILMDNLGYGELGCYGGGILRGAPTPRIDALASEGTRLLNFNVEAQCTPSRSAIMTGRYSIRSGTHSVPMGGGLDGLTQWEVTIAKTLSGAGYATAHFGKWHLGSEDGRLPIDQGFDEWYGIPRTTDEAFWPSEPAAKAAGVSYMHVMEGRKGGKSRKGPVYDLKQRTLIDTELAFQQQLAASPAYAALPRGAIHADLFRDNVMFDTTESGDQLTGLFDFYFAGVDTYLFDIAVCLNDWCIDLESGRLEEGRAAALVAAYAAERALSGSERRLLPAVMRGAALRFWLSRLWDLHLPRDARLLTAHDPTHFERVLRERVATPWHPAATDPDFETA